MNAMATGFALSAAESLRPFHDKLPGAVLRPTRDPVWRFVLWRPVDRLVLLAKPRGPLVVSMLNPSKANKRKNDQTIRWLLGYCARHGYDRLVVVNLTPLISTDPKRLRTAAAHELWPVCSGIWLASMVRGRDVLCAWGAGVRYSSALDAVACDVRNLARRTLCLGVTKDGHPWHPLRKSQSLDLQEWPSV